MNSAVSKLADVNANERALLDQCNDLLSTVASMQVSFCVSSFSHSLISLSSFSFSHMKNPFLSGKRIQLENTHIAIRTHTSSIEKQDKEQVSADCTIRPKDEANKLNPFFLLEFMKQKEIRDPLTESVIEVVMRVFHKLKSGSKFSTFMYFHSYREGQGKISCKFLMM